MPDIVLAHTATKLADAAGRVVVCGSHGGAYVGLLAAEAGVRAITAWHFGWQPAQETSGTGTFTS